MKQRLPSTLLFVAFFALVVAGCAAPASLETPDAAISLSPASLAPTEPAPTPTNPSPTPAQPLPCSIAFDSDRDGNREIYVMGPDGENLRNLSNHPAEDWDPAWSPDGVQIAFVSNRIEGGMEGHFIYVMDAGGGAARKLTHDNGSDQPDWSHDGRTLTYTADDDIFVIAADGSGRSTNLTNSLEKDARPGWSPDDRQIAWLSSGNGSWDIFVMDADGKNAKQITQNARVNYMAWTVDGRLFTHMENSGAGCNNCLMDADGSNMVEAGGKGEIQRYLPFWTGNWERVECIELDREGNADIFQIGEIFPETFHNLTNHPAADRNPDWPSNCGPDGAAAPKGEGGRTADPEEIIIGFADGGQDQPQRKENFQKACDELDIRCVYGKMPDLVEQGVDAVIQDSKDGQVDALRGEISAAADAGVPVFLLDAFIDHPGVYSVAVNREEWILKSLEWMFTQMGGKGEIAFYDLDPASGDLALIEGLLKKYPDVRLVDRRVGISEHVEIKQNVGELLESYPNLGAIWSNDMMSDILLGMADTGLPGNQWPSLRCDAVKDGLYIWLDRLEDFPGMRCMAVANTPGMAYDAVYAAFYLASGSQMDRAALEGPYRNALYVETAVITSDNLLEWMGRINNDLPDYIPDQTMLPEEIKEKWFHD